jgi:hypothetical protein
MGAQLHGEHIRLLPLFQPVAQPAIVPIHTVARDPPKGHVRNHGPFEHCDG